MPKAGRPKELDPRPKAPEVNVVNAAALQAEVKSFASSLGLAAAGVGSGFDDSDFRPPVAGQKAKSRLVRASDTAKPQPDARKGKLAERPRAKLAAAEPGSGQQQLEAPDIVRERNWNAGVGPRPGQHAK